MTKPSKPLPKRKTAKPSTRKPRVAKSRKPRRARRKRGILTETLIWEGVTLSVRYEPTSFGGQAHLQIQVIAPEPDAPLPITETGYRSHFLLRGIVEEAGGPLAYVRTWLDEAARGPKWKRVRSRWLQLDLFGQAQ